MTMWASAREDLGARALEDQLDLRFSLSKRAWKLHSIIPLVVASEFALLCAAAYLGGAIYHQASHADWAAFEQRGRAAIFVAALVTLTAVNLRQFVAI